MKQYKVVYAENYRKTPEGYTHKARCDEYTFELSGDMRSDQAFLLNHYASKGWKLVQVIHGNGVPYTWYLYLEKEV